MMQQDSFLSIILLQRLIIHVAKVIFLSRTKSSVLSLLLLLEDQNGEDPCVIAAISTTGVDIDGVNISAIDLFERLTI
jgi:hypothetical protein